MECRFQLRRWQVSVITSSSLLSHKFDHRKSSGSPFLCSGNTPDGTGSNAPVTTNGTCGVANGSAVCGNWPQGSCCSAGGYCGNTTDHCGNGCQSGPCIVGGETFDGTCGPSHGNTVCGAWPQGSCCSAAGYCGNTTDHCGAGCQSGPCSSATNTSGPSGDVYISPSIWSDADPVVYCVPPCLFILPPLALPSPATITFPLLTTSLEVAWLTSQVTTLANGHVSTSTGYNRITKTTTLTIPPVTTSLIDLWNVNVTVTETDTSSVFYITSSVLPPPFTITDDRNPLSQSGVTNPPVTRTITPPPYPYSTTSPGSNDHPPLTWKPGPPGPECLTGCGHKCLLFCSHPCLLLCSEQGNDFNDPIDPDSPGPPTKPTGSVTSATSLCSNSVVTDYFVSCSSVNPSSSSCTTTSSAVVSGCNIWATTKTTGADTCPTVSQDNDQGQDGGLPASRTTGLTSGSIITTTSAPSGTITSLPSISTTSPLPSCSMHYADPDKGINSAYCVCDGSAFALLPSTSSCAYTSPPSSTINPVSSLIITSNCMACTLVGTNAEDCSLMPDCTPIGTSSTPTSTSLSPTATVQINTVVIGLRSISLLSEGGIGSSDEWWDVYNAVNNKFDGCAKALFERGISGSDNNQRYPTKLGSFNLSGPQNCYYQALNSDTVGTVTCDNGVSIQCAVNPNIDTSASVCNQPKLTESESFLPSIYCQYTPS